MFLAATMLLSSCSQEDEFIDSPVPGTQGDLVEITIGTPQGNNSRVSYDDTTSPFAWEAGDEIIAVGFGDDGTYKGQNIFQMKSELTEDKKTATFRGELPKGAKQFKVYYKAENLAISATNGTPKVDYSTQSLDISSAETQTVHMKKFYQLATPKMSSEMLLDPTAAKNLKLENSLLRLDVKSYPTAIGDLENILIRTNIAKGAAQTAYIGITNTPKEQQAFKAFILFDPTVMAQTAGETFEVVFVGNKGSQAISQDNTKATFNNAGSRYNLVAYQDDTEIQDVTTKAVLKNWTAWHGAILDASTHTITSKLPGNFTPEMVSKAMGVGKDQTLIVKGDINGHDIRIIREAAGCMYDNSQNKKIVEAPLRHLDLSAARIKASDDIYAEDKTIGAYHTKDNIISDRMFIYSALTTVKLPEGITEIGNSAFFVNFFLKDVNIPSTVTKLGHDVFTHNESLTTIVIPDNVTSIGNGLFAECKKLQTVKLSENCERITSRMFASCEVLKSVTIPASVKSIASEAFESTILDTLVIPANVEYLSSRLVRNVTTLKSVTIESGSTTLKNTFAEFTASKNCDLTIPGEWNYKVSQNAENQPVFEGLVWKTITLVGDQPTYVNVDAENHTITTKSAGHIVPEMIKIAIGTGTDNKLIVKGEINSVDIKAIREAAGCMFNNSKGSNLTKVLLKHLDLSGAVIKASEEPYAESSNKVCKTENNKISAYMFIHSGLNSIKLPEGITEIGHSAFRGSSYLKSVNFPTTVTTLGQSAFMENTALTSIVIPNNVSSVGNNLFSNCIRLTEITLSEKMTEISRQMLYKTAITSITIPASVTVIRELALQETKLKSLVIPATVTEIEKKLLGEMTTLRKLTFEGASTKYSTSEISGIFTDYKDSGNCDLVIPAEWKNRVGNTNGTFIFEKVNWNSIKDLEGNDLTVKP